MKRRIRVLLLLIVPMCCLAALTGVELANAASGPPAVTLSTVSGPAGTSFTVTLPAACTVPSDISPDPEALLVTMSSALSSPYSNFFTGTSGAPINSVTVVVPSGTPAGHYSVSASCYSNSLTYGAAYFTVTGGPSLPALTVNPTSAAPGGSVEVSGDCSPSDGQPTASLYVILVSATDPNLSSDFFTTSGTGPVLTVDVVVPTTLVPGQYYVQATCDNYVTETQFAESSLMVTGSQAPTTLSTSLTSTSGASGASITASPDDTVFDTVTLSGANASTASGSLAFSVFSDSQCTNYVASAGWTTYEAGGISGAQSYPEALPVGTYYWQVNYSGDASNAPALSPCTAEQEIVTNGQSATTLSTSLSGGGSTGAAISVPAGTAVSDAATLGGTNAASAGSTVTYSVYADAACTDSVASAGTVDVTAGKVPASNTVSLSTPGTYYWQASYVGDPNNASSVSTCGSEVETVTAAVAPSTSLTTSLSGGGTTGASISVPAGTAVSDTATLSGTNAAVAGGTVTYGIYSDSACTASVTSGGTVDVTAGKVPASSSVSLTTPGTYYWQASYSGDTDSENASSVSTCGSEVETVTAVAASTSLLTSLSGGGSTGASISVPANTAVADSAMLSGTNAASAGGTVTYSIYSDSACSDFVTGGGTVDVTAGKVPASSTVSLSSPGTYYWQATYSGDTSSDNAPSVSTCGNEVETVTAATSASTNLTTTLSGGGSTGATLSVPAGTAVTDTATISGANASGAGGTVTYSVYSDSRCTHLMVNAGTVEVSHGKVPSSNAVTLSQPGTYYWEATYSGDATNAPSKSATGSEVETVGAVTKGSTSLTTTLTGGGSRGATLSVPANTAVTDTATLSGTNAATAGGTVTYSVYSDSRCTHLMVSAGTVQVSRGKVPSSNPVTLSKPGTYYWQASYSGDATNVPSKSATGSEVETVVAAVIKTSTNLTTTLMGGRSTGASISVSANTAVKDTAALSGTNATSAGGTVTYSVYSDSRCTHLMVNAGTVEVSRGKVPSSNPVTLSKPGTYYWEASYSGDAANAPSRTAPGSEVETVGFVGSRW